MKKILLFQLLGFITMASYAQVDSSKLSSSGMIQYSPSGFFRAAKYSIGGKQASRDQVYAVLMSDTASANEFNEFKKYKHISNYSGGAAVVFLLIPLITDHFKTINSTPGRISLTIGYGLIIPDIFFGFKAIKHYKRSLMLHNQQYK
jgi:hypothetical protein